MGFIRAASMFGSDKPDLSVASAVKNVPIQTQLDALILRNLDTTQKAEDAIDRALPAIAEQTPETLRQIRAGIAQMGDIYSQRYPAALAAQREAYYQARLGTQEQELARARARDKAQAAALGLPGRSSYRDLMESRVMGEIGSQAALERAAMERADYLDVMKNRVQLQERIPYGLQQIAAVEGMPATVTAQYRNIPLENLRVMTQLDQMNKFYMLYKNRSFTEKLADFDDEFWNTVGQITSMVANVKGAGGGGGAVRDVAKPGSQVDQSIGAYQGSVEPAGNYYPGSTNPYAQPGHAYGTSGVRSDIPSYYNPGYATVTPTPNQYESPIGPMPQGAPVQIQEAGSIPAY